MEPDPLVDALRHVEVALGIYEATLVHSQRDPNNVQQLTFDQRVGITFAVEDLQGKGEQRIRTLQVSRGSERIGAMAMGPRQAGHGPGAAELGVRDAERHLEGALGELVGLERVCRDLPGALGEEEVHQGRGAEAGESAGDLGPALLGRELHQLLELGRGLRLDLAQALHPAAGEHEGVVDEAGGRGGSAVPSSDPGRELGTARVTDLQMVLDQVFEDGPGRVLAAEQRQVLLVAEVRACHGPPLRPEPS